MLKLWAAAISFLILCEPTVVSADENEDEHCEATPEGSKCSHQITQRKGKALLQRAVSNSSKSMLVVSENSGEKTTQWCENSPRQTCRILCSAPACPSGQCAMRKGRYYYGFGMSYCCDHTCEPEKKTDWCEDSPKQTCRLVCSEPACPSGQCAMRQGNCCDHTCKSTQDPAKKCKKWCSKTHQCNWKACNGCDFCSNRRAPARRTPAPTPEPSPPAATYQLTSSMSCGWGGGCTGSEQAYCYQTSDPAVPYKKDGFSKLMPNVGRSAAEATCGPICSACATCEGFNWIASLHGVHNACWFRKKPACQVRPDAARDCYKKNV